MTRASLLPLSTSVLTAVLLAGCAVGPDFTAPVAPDVSGYDSTPTASVTTDGTQILVPGNDIPAAWWELFGSKNLNLLITQAIKDNPDLAAAQASLRVAQDNLAAGASDLFPTVSGSFTSTRQKTSGAQNDNLFPGYTYTLHNASVSVSYGLDIFGGTRRAIEQLQAQSDYAAFQQEATYLTLTGNVVTTAIQEASLRDQIEAARSIIGDQEQVLKILNARFEAGAVAKSAVAEQQSSLATAKSNLPPLEHQLVVTRHALSVLVGQMPQQAPGAEFKLTDLQLPNKVPLSVPSKLVEQRPDIRSAQETLHAASAGVGVAIAARLPEITLSADIGSMATTIGKLFTPGGGFWALSGNAAETLFDAGALEDKEDAARDTLDEAAAEYRKTVLSAFQDVADTLHALQSDAELLTARTEAEKAAAESLSLAKIEFQSGSIGSADLLTTEATEQNALSDLVRAKAQRYADTAALFVALGGGWWNRDHDPQATAAYTSDIPAKGDSHD